MRYVYRCKNNCHVSNKDGRCPRCGNFLLKDDSYDEKDQDSFNETMKRAEEKTKEIHYSHL